MAEEWIDEAVNDIVIQFGAASFENQSVQGNWMSGGVLFQDTLSRLIIDVPDTVKNRRWMKEFKKRWKNRLEQLELWMFSYRVDVD